MATKLNIQITNNAEANHQIEKLKINIKHLNEVAQFGDYGEMQKLAAIISARGKALAMWNSGVASVKVQADIIA